MPLGPFNLLQLHHNIKLLPVQNLPVEAGHISDPSLPSGKATRFCVIEAKGRATAPWPLQSRTVQQNMS